jgi:galactitol-specific phosphotransferase system IIC component
MYAWYNTEMVEKTAMGTAASLELAVEFENWFVAQYMALSDEKREMMDKKEEDMMALFNF